MKATNRKMTDAQLGVSSQSTESEKRSQTWFTLQALLVLACGPSVAACSIAPATNDEVGATDAALSVNRAASIRVPAVCRGPLPAAVSGTKTILATHQTLAGGDLQTQFFFDRSGALWYPGIPAPQRPPATTTSYFREYARMWEGGQPEAVTGVEGTAIKWVSYFGHHEVTPMPDGSFAAVPSIYDFGSRALRRAVRSPSGNGFESGGGPSTSDFWFGFAWIKSPELFATPYRRSLDFEAFWGLEASPPNGGRSPYNGAPEMAADSAGHLYLTRTSDGNSIKVSTMDFASGAIVQQGAFEKLDPGYWAVHTALRLAPSRASILVGINLQQEDPDDEFNFFQIEDRLYDVKLGKDGSYGGSKQIYTTEATTLKDTASDVCGNVYVLTNREDSDTGVVDVKIDRVPAAGGPAQTIWSTTFPTGSSGSYPRRLHFGVGAWGESTLYTLGFAGKDDVLYGVPVGVPGDQESQVR